jgi:hypothetical protein
VTGVGLVQGPPPPRQADPQRVLHARTGRVGLPELGFPDPGAELVGPLALGCLDGLERWPAACREPEPDALPLIVTHGYPSSLAKFVDVIGPPHGSPAMEAPNLLVTDIRDVFRGLRLPRTSQALCQICRLSHPATQRKE